MPKVSKDSAQQRQEDGPIIDLRVDLDGYTVSFTSLGVMRRHARLRGASSYACCSGRKTVL